MSKQKEISTRTLVRIQKVTLRASKGQSIWMNGMKACSVDSTVHYSFDFAQQVHTCTCIPGNPLQPGPIYFETPRKCGIFGIMCKAVPRQLNYLIDEASDVGKGANTSVSYGRGTMDEAKPTSIFMLTTALGRIKITISFGTPLGE